MEARPGGNPGGRPKVTAVIRDLARDHGAQAIERLVARRCEDENRSGAPRLQSPPYSSLSHLTPNEYAQQRLDLPTAEKVMTQGHPKPSRKAGSNPTPQTAKLTAAE